MNLLIPRFSASLPSGSARSSGIGVERSDRRQAFQQRDSELPRDPPRQETGGSHACGDRASVSTGYRGGGLSMQAIIAVTLIHVGVGAMLLSLGIMQPRSSHEQRLSVFDVQPATAEPAPPPPPEPAQEVAPQSPLPPRPTAVQPAIKLSTNAPAIAAQPSPQPAVAVEIAAPPAEKSPAPPAPVTAPDFSAVQLNNPGPKYPFQARRNKQEGVVLLKVLVTPGGRAGEVRLEQSSGFQTLDRAAMKTVRRWRFVPASQAGKAVAAWVVVPIGFSLST